MTTLQHELLGEITIRRHPMSRAIRASVAPTGNLRITIPKRLPLLAVKAFIKTSQNELSELLHESRPALLYHDGMLIGKSHSIRVVIGARRQVSRKRNQIIVTLPDPAQLAEPAVQNEVRQVVIRALRREASAYLPRRLQSLATQHGFSYQTVRLSHAGSRWGSCSSHGTVSLNIALMRLPHELIDYVLIHELAHTKQMNHSQQFWQLVQTADPEFKAHRKSLKAFTPIC